MSHQPSQLDTLKDNASSAYNTVSDKVSDTITPDSKKEPYDENKDKANFKKDDHGNTVKKGDLKDQLNEAARGGSNQPKEREETIVEKVFSYIPGVSSLRQSASEQGKAEKSNANDGPPTRPDHDVQVEQFLRGQYHSRSGDGMPNLDSKN